MLCLCGNLSLMAQDKVYQGIILDEVMVKAVQEGFDVNRFIAWVKNDTTFYQAFRNLRLLNYRMYNDIVVYGKGEGMEKASYQSVTRQIVENRCRRMLTETEKVKGDFYEGNREYRYLTASLYAHLFFTRGVVCAGQGSSRKGGRARYEEQLRMLIFNPGQRIRGIPGIGENVAIYEEPTRSQYDFRLSRESHLGEDCFVFRAKPKKEFLKDVVINDLKTWIRVSDRAIVAREYSLSYNTLIYDFDVVMKVKLKPVQSLLVPYEISYRGNWDAVTRPRENAAFTAIFTDFQ